MSEAKDTRTLPDRDQCTLVLVMNRRLGMFNVRHLVEVEEGPAEDGRKRYKHTDIRLLPGLNLAPLEWIEKVRSLNPAYASAFDPRTGCLELVGSSKDWAKVREVDAIKMVSKTGDLDTLEAIHSYEKREAVIDALADEIETRRKHNRLREEVQREQRRAKRREPKSRFH